MNISWLTRNVPSVVKHALTETVKSGITRAFQAHANDKNPAHAFVNAAGHYAVSAAKDLTDDYIQSLGREGFVPVAEMDPTEQLQAAMPDSVMSDAQVAVLVQREVAEGIKAAKAEMRETIERIAAQRDKALADLQSAMAELTASKSKSKS